MHVEDEWLTERDTVNDLAAIAKLNKLLKGS